MFRILVPALLVLSLPVDLAAELPIKAYPTRLALNGPLQPGVNQTLTGTGAPDGPGIYVELWRAAPGSAIAESVASVETSAGNFTFQGVDVAEGEHYYVTLSRSWAFNTDGDPEGWDQLTNHVTLDVSNGALNVTIEGIDPALFNFFDYDADVYRVIEIRLRNPAVAAHQDPPFQDLGIYWGDFSTSASLHFAGIPTEMSDFETIMIPMNVGEVRIIPGPLELDRDGLWATGLRDVLRLDPLDTVDPSAVGQVFQIDLIRIREDFRLDFHQADDRSGIREFTDVTDVSLGDGFLSYAVTDAPAVDPFFRFGFASGKIESSYFSGFAIGMDNPEAVAGDGHDGDDRPDHHDDDDHDDDDDDDDDHDDDRHGHHSRDDDDDDDRHGHHGRDDDDDDRRGHHGHDDDPNDHDDDVPAAPSSDVILRFNDDDSGSDYTDDSGTAQVAEFPTSLAGRQDVFAVVDSRTSPPGEWTEDGRVPVEGLQLESPASARSGDRMRIDYLGLIPAEPFGPSDPLLAELPIISVEIDIRPGSDRNNIHLRSRGVVPVAILSTSAFDALTVDPLTITLAGAGVRLRGNGRPQASPEDVNEDGRPDLLVHIETRDLELTSEDTEAVLSGMTFDGRTIRGVDTVRIVQ